MCKIRLSSFTTEGTTGLEDLEIDGSINEILADPSVKIYNVQGIDVSNIRGHLPNGVYIIQSGNKAAKILINN